MPTATPYSRALNSSYVRHCCIESCEYLNLAQVAASPFYAISFLLRLDCFLWNQIITAIREEDRRIHGISDTSIGHTEQINKTFDVVKRGGSLGRFGKDEPVTKQSQDGLVEDFQHLVKQTTLLWKTREMMAAVQRKNSDARWNSLTNAITYLSVRSILMRKFGH